MTEGGDPRHRGGRTAQETPTAAGRNGGGKGGAEQRMVPPAEPRSYYGRPVIKEPIWHPDIPLYFFTGGLGGASAGLAFAARLTGNDKLARAATANAFAGIAISPLLLIRDLGMPSRFYNMFRVFKVTSPMSLGSWLLATEGALVTVTAAHEFLGLFPKPLARLAGALAGLLGMPVSTYTAALVSNTSVPVWHEGRYLLPFTFAGGAAMSAGAAALLLTDPDHAGPARRLIVVGAALEGLSMEISEKRMGKIAEPYKTGVAGKLEKGTKALAGGGAGLTLVGGVTRRRGFSVAGAVLALAGAVLGRWMVFKAGFQSAAAPQYTVEVQRDRMGRPG